MKEITPLVSIIVPTQNRLKYLERAIKSIKEQTYNNWECIIVDDCSDIDIGKTLAANLVKDIRIKVIRNKTIKYASGSRNAGIKEARGKYIAFLDDDDYWDNQKLELQVDMIERSEFDAVYCWSYLIYKNGTRVERNPSIFGNIFDLMLAGQPTCNCSTFLVKKTMINKVKGFNIRLKRGNDGDLIRRISEFGNIGVVKKNLVYYQVDTEGSNISKNNYLGNLRSIKSLKYRRKYFKDALDSRPGIEAKICLDISYCYSCLGKYKYAIKYLCQSVLMGSKSIKMYLNLFLKIIYRLLFSKILTSVRSNKR